MVKSPVSYEGYELWKLQRIFAWRTKMYILIECLTYTTVAMIMMGKSRARKNPIPSAGCWQTYRVQPERKWITIWHLWILKSLYVLNSSLYNEHWWDNKSSKLCILPLDVDHWSPTKTECIREQLVINWFIYIRKPQAFRYSLPLSLNTIIKAGTNITVLY